jgi:large subunit ribosomal protein L22
MIAKACGKYIRISPYKVRRIANELRNKLVVEAESYLGIMTNKGASAIKKVLHSARTNYLQQDKNADEQNLFISKISIDHGPTMKRFHPISRGRGAKILKRSCSINIEVSNLQGE